MVSKRFLILAGLALVVLIILALTDLAQAAGDACTPVRNSPGVVTNVAQYPTGIVPRYQVTFKAEAGVGAVRTTVRYTVSQPITVVSGCVTSAREILSARIRRGQ